jgi:type II secretory pathway component PulC
MDYANGSDVLFSFPENVTSGLYLYSTGQSSDFNLQKGDFIVGINGIEVRTLYDFIKEFNVLLSTDTVTLSIYRNGNPMNITN